MLPGAFSDVPADVTVNGVPLIALPGVLIVGIIGFPRWFVSFMRKRRVKAFLQEFPNSLDIIVRAVKSGLPLNDGVRLIGGEARVRHVYTSTTEPVRTRWADRLGDRAWIASRPEAVAAGWFGPTVADHVLPRIGDLVIATKGALALVRSRTEPGLTTFLGHHGSLTEEEQHIPLLHTIG